MYLLYIVVSVVLIFVFSCSCVEAATHPHLRGTHSPHHTPHGTPHGTPQRTPVASPTGSPKLGHKMWPFADKHFAETGYDNINVHEIVEQLSQSENLNEQADIIHYLYVKQ